MEEHMTRGDRLFYKLARKLCALTGGHRMVFVDAMLEMQKELYWKGINQAQVSALAPSYHICAKCRHIEYIDEMEAAVERSRLHG